MEPPGYTTYCSVSLKDEELVRGNPQRKYKQFTDLLDVLTQHQVTLSLVTYVYALVASTLYHKASSITKCSGDLVSLGCYGALELSESYH
jgi:hypothetical protein